MLGSMEKGGEQDAHTMRKLMDGRINKGCVREVVDARTPRPPKIGEEHETQTYETVCAMPLETEH